MLKLANKTRNVQFPSRSNDHGYGVWIML